jgi:hypothetical protein
LLKFAKKSFYSTFSYFTHSFKAFANKNPLSVSFSPQVKRQAVLEIQRAVASAETRAIDMIAQERIKMEKIYGEINRAGDGIDGDHQTTGSNVRMNHK